MEAKAIAKYIRISPRKVHFICNEIRGKDIDEASKKCWIIRTTYG